MKQVARRVAHRRIGRNWDRMSTRSGGRDNWWRSPTLRGYVQQRISPETGNGVVGELDLRLQGRRLEHGVSVGCGGASKEMTLLRENVVERFSLYELSEQRVREATAAAEQKGLADRVAFHRTDPFQEDGQASYDLVYWDHSLHHMFDVRAALEWSARVLAPGGLLVVNDFIGPTRLQWTVAEVRLARAYLREARPHLATKPKSVPYSTPLSRLAMLRKDPSEAPQSDRIPAAVAATCPGFELRPIGCTLIDICGPRITPVTEEGNPALDLLTAWDRRAEEQGFSHFAFGIWEKPA